MTSTCARLAVIGALLCCSGRAVAKGITYDCDTAAAHFSELALPAGSAPVTVTGNLQLREMAESQNWLPIARLALATAAEPGARPTQSAGFSLTVVPKDKAKLPPGVDAVQMLSYNATGKEDEPLPLSLLAKPGTVQSFSLTYDGENVVIRLGDETKSIPLKTTEPVVRIICSTGEFLFTELTITPGR